MRSPFSYRSRLALLFAVLALGAAMLAPSVAQADPAYARQGAPVIIGVSDAARMDEVRARVAALGGVVTRRYEWGGYRVTLPASVERGAFSAAADDIPGVKYVTKETWLHAVGGTTRPTAGPFAGDSWFGVAFSPNDPAFPGQWGLARIGAPTAWDTAIGAGVTVAILDTGVDYTHPDLLGAVVLGPDFVDNDLDPRDEHWHGTAMAGIAGAWTNNSLYGASAAPGCWLMAVRVLDAAGNGSAADVADGITWAAGNGADVISLSLAGSGAAGMEPVIDAVAFARSQGCLVVAASGNASTNGEWAQTYPASCDGVIGTGAAASSTADVVWAGESHGTRPDGTPVVTVIAPGQYIYSLYPGSAVATYTGTSASTAMVSGAAAVVWSAYPGATADQVASVLASSAVDVAPAGRDVEAGWGRIRLDEAVLHAPVGFSGLWAPPGLDVDLTWTDDFLCESGFVIERAQDTSASAAFSHLATVGPAATSYADSAGLDWTSTWYYRIRAFNGAGYSPYSDVIAVRMEDTTPPTSTLYVNGLSYAEQWWSAVATVSVTATDTQSGLGDIWVDYRGGPEVYVSPFAFGEGIWPVAYWATDSVGNTEASRIATVSVDLTPPTVSSDATTTPYRGSATIHIGGVDNLSGFAGAAYRVDGGSEASGTTAVIGGGVHSLWYRARDAAGNWSAEAGPYTITVMPTVTVYRFFNRRTGTHFYTGSEVERAQVQATLGHVYAYEGAAYQAFSGSAGGAVPLYRFYNRRNGTHFYTASEVERTAVQGTLGATYSFEGPSYYVLPTAGPTTRTVHRFFNRRLGAHFYTASEAEKAQVEATLGWLYAYEGPAFYVPQ